MTNEDARNIIKSTGDVIWGAEKKILRHFGISAHDRYAGEFPYPDKITGAPKLMEAFSFGDENARDEFFDAVQNTIDKNGWNDVSVNRENETDRKTPWPYQLDITVTGDGIHSTIDAYQKMAEVFHTVAAPYPKRPGTPWQEFLLMHAVKPEMRHKGGAESQIEKMGAIPKFYRDAELYVVGTHTSKSITLPVAQIECPRHATLVTFRDNFHDICVSVDAKFPIEDKRDFKTLFNTKAKDGGFEGFPQNLIHDGYDKNQKKFSFNVGDYPTLLIVLGEIFHQDRSKDPGIKPKDPAQKKPRL